MLAFEGLLVPLVQFVAIHLRAKKKLPEVVVRRVDAEQTDHTYYGWQDR